MEEKDMKNRRDLKPDAQAFDKIIIETVPRWKESEMSGSEWRISAKTSFFRKGKLIAEERSSNVETATYLVGARHIFLCDDAKGFFSGEENICDQEGCENIATKVFQKKYDYSRDGNKSKEPSTAFRLFCERHSQRGDCGLDDSDSNYIVSDLLK